MLETAMRDEQEHVCWRATEALGQIGHPSAIPALVTILRDKVGCNWRVRCRAATALGKIGDFSATLALTQELSNANASWRGWIIDALGEMGDAAAIPALESLLKESDNYTYARIQRVIAKMQTKNP